LLFLNQARERFEREGRIRTRRDLVRAVVEGATDRARPLLMTVASDVIGLLPIMWGAGTGSETMRRIAAPMVGGVVTATLVTLLVLPVLYALLHSRGLPSGDASSCGEVGPMNDAGRPPSRNGEGSGSLERR
ncbi:MAG: efflux RND transporter permease subunit, partial [Gemmatimonadetes bacterium]|nr:efflux RND transporter permease subunit [Gemmatimonadota bacterium]